MFHRITVVLALAAVFPVPAQAAVHTVGTDATCSFPGIQAAIDAAAANPGEDVIRITNTFVWSNLSLVIGAQDLVVEGGFSNCSAASPSGRTTLSGLGGPAAPVVSITGGGIRRFRNLDITQGDAAQDGGGIRYNGDGEVVLSHVTVSANSAGRHGGGISASGNAQARITFEDQVLIEGNQAAQRGGGVALTTNSTLVTPGENVRFVNNIAGTAGGGLHVAFNSNAFLASRSGPDGSFVGNSATNGGAIAVRDALLCAYGTDANRPFRIKANRASGLGGAIAVELGRGFAVLRSFHLINNRAQDGAAVYLDTGVGFPGNLLGLNITESFPCGFSPLVEVPCEPGTNGCNLIEQNAAETGNGTPTAGATVRALSRGSVRIDRTTFARNRGAHVMRTTDAAIVRLHGSLLASNGTAAVPLLGAPIALDFGLVASETEELSLRNNTIAANVTAVNHVIALQDAPDTLAFNHNLVWQPGQLLLTSPFAIANSPVHNWDFNTGSDMAQLPAPWNVNTLSPRFVDPSAEDFRLRVGSSVVDLYPNLPPNGALASDLDGRPRPADIPLRATLDRIADPGAFETQPTDEFILNGRFNSDLRHWSSDAPAGSLTWNPSDSGTAPGTGHAAFSVSAAQVPPGSLRMAALKYCFNVPGNGRYRITGRALRSSNVFADVPSLTVTVRRDTPDCTGPFVAQYGQFFGSGDGWRGLAVPIEFPINFQDISNVTVQISLDVRESSQFAVSDGLSGAFDNIRLIDANGDELFMDDFDLL